MTGELHPQAEKVLQMAEKFRSLIDERARQAVAGKFTGTDEAETVTATLTGQYFLTSLHIDDELPRLGAETVAQRINEALQNARTAAIANAEAEDDRLFAALSDMRRTLEPIADNALRTPHPEEWT